jgi:hypothetical protein
MTVEPPAIGNGSADLLLAQRATIGRVRRMRRTGDQAWSPRACAKQGLRSAMRFDPIEFGAKRLK